MTKKKVTKKRATKAKPKKTVSKKFSSAPTNHMLMQNMISLQKVLLHLSEKLTSLTMQTSKLLELFEISATSLAKKEIEAGRGDRETKKIAEKLDNLFEQNKIIARGLTLLHEPAPMQTHPAPRPPQQLKTPMEKEGSPQGYQKSIATEPPTSDSENEE